MTGTLTVDVVIPYDDQYTPSSLLNRAIDSVSSQTVSTNVIICEESGVSRARNAGLDQSNNRYVAFLDADDFWNSNKLERQVSRLQDSRTGICLTNSYLKRSDEQTSIGPNPSAAVQSLFLGSVYGLTSTILIDTKRVESRFDESLDRREDHLFVISAATEAELSILVDALTTVDRHGSGLSADDDPYIKWQAHQIFYEKATKIRPELRSLNRTFWHQSHLNVGYLHYRQGQYGEAITHYLHALRYRPILTLQHLFPSIE